jgi:hypothetical protein
MWGSVKSSLVGVDLLSKLREQGNFFKISELDIIDLPVAKFQKTITPAIPHIIALLTHRQMDVRRASADTLLTLSEHGNISNFLTWALLTYS